MSKKLQMTKKPNDQLFIHTTYMGQPITAVLNLIIIK